MLDAVILERKHTATTITVAIPTPHATSSPLKPEHGNLRTKKHGKQRYSFFGRDETEKSSKYDVLAP